MSSSEESSKKNNTQIVVAIVGAVALIITAIIQIVPQIKQSTEVQEVLDETTKGVFCDVVIERAKAYKIEFEQRIRTSKSDTDNAVLNLWKNKFEGISKYDCESIEENFKDILLDFERAFNKVVSLK